MKKLGYIKWWLYAAMALPSVALATIIVSYYIGWSTIWESTISITVISFVGICVLWWWWAMMKLMDLYNLFQRTDGSLVDIKTEFLKLKKEIIDKK